MIKIDFTGKNVLITGGTKGIGRGIASLFAKNSAHVFATYLNDVTAADDMVKDTCGKVEIIKCDSSDEIGVRKLFDDFEKKNIAIDILVNNAGIIKDSFLMMMKTSDWDSVLDTNLKSVFLNSRAALRGMIRKKWGRIINAVSPSAFLGVAGQTNYSASKGAVMSFTKSLSKEVARYNICVNAVSPGIINTPMTEALDKKILDSLISNVAMGKMGSTKDVANAVAFLASDYAGYITGQCINIDGGLT
jgi:3-oxoacyl-[acyl-carrier protein] reductase